jgi:hypothetical protein
MQLVKLPGGSAGLQVNCYCNPLAIRGQGMALGRDFRDSRKGAKAQRGRALRQSRFLFQAVRHARSFMEGRDAAPGETPSRLCAFA